MIDLIGLLGILFVTSCGLAQLRHMWKVKDANSTSYLWAGTLWLGVLCYLVYAIAIGSLIFVLSSIFSLVSITTIIGMKYYLERKK